jgi:anti-sigma-K factor RskA
VTGLPTVPGTFYEVWLMNASPQRLLSLGVLDSSEHGVFQIPAGLDLSSYPVVDISLQPFNGSPAHSGTSSVRGSFRA